MRLVGSFSSLAILMLWLSFRNIAEANFAQNQQLSKVLSIGFKAQTSECPARRRQIEGDRRRCSRPAHCSISLTLSRAVARHQLSSNSPQSTGLRSEMCSNFSIGVRSFPQQRHDFLWLTHQKKLSKKKQNLQVRTSAIPKYQH